MVVEESDNSASASTLPPSDRPEPDEDWSGRRVGEFQILRRIGRGGMGQVYLAEQTSLKRKVAVKMLRPELSANRTSLQRFKAEAEAVAKLNHPNIVQIFTINEQDGNHYMALEYVEGRNLRDYLNRKGPPELPVCLNLMRQIASALQRAHDSGFIHRDVKPENILLTRKGEVKVTDFGLSRCFTDNGQQLNLTQSGVAMGTPLYMSPEQVQGKPADIRSDIYSFGVTCYHLLTGQTPFRGASAFDVALQHVMNDPPPLANLRPDLPADLVAMIQKMMAKKPEDRYQSFKEILRDFGKLRESVTAAMTLPTGSSFGSGVQVAPLALGETESAMDVSPAARNPRDSKKWLTRIIVALAAVGILVTGAAMRLVIHRLTAKEPASKSQAATEPTPYVSKEERFKLEGAQNYADPNPTVDELKRGVDFQVDLLAYYFKKGRLDDAERFSRELQERKYKSTKFQTHPYQALGKLGHALVLAFRDDANQALKEMGELIRLTTPRPAMGGFQGLQFTIAGVPSAMFEHSEIKRLIVDALNRIATDLQVTSFENHKQLDLLRKAANRPFRFGPK